jgi:D-3-phosphoglycerate dehydrogenase / 2-oxoglutarate reductase
MTKIAITTSTFSTHSIKPKELLIKKGYSVSINPEKRKLSEKELLNFVSDKEAIIAGTESYSEEVLNSLPKLKVISRLGIGMDNINIDIAKKKNIKIYRTSTSPAQAVAELSLGLMIDLYRNITTSFNRLKSGKWKKYMGFLLSEKTLGIIGMGSIGKTLVKLTKGFNFKILAYDKKIDTQFAKENNVTYCELDYLMKNSDIISIHLNLSDETKNLINKDYLNLMKTESIIINTSRGEVLNEGDLFNLLKNKRILGAALDVFSKEPYSGKLLELNNVILTPHIAAYAREVRIKMEMEAVNNLINGMTP